MIALPGASCQSACDRTPKALVYDLAARLPVAERWAQREVILFGTPAAERHLAEGFFREAAPAQGDGFVWAGREAAVSFQIDRPATRTVILDLAAFRGIGAQSAEVRLNDTTIGRIAVGSGDRQRHLVTLPAAPQRAGENRLAFRFAETRSPADVTPGSADKRQLAAAFYSMVSGPDTDAGLLDLVGRGAPVPFGVTMAGAVPTVVQSGPAVIRYALRVPGDGELRFSPDLHPSARAAAATASFRVTIERGAGAEKDLWSRTIGPRDAAPGEVVVPLGGSEGEIVRVGLHVGGNRHAWGLWSAPRVMGRGRASLLGPRQVAPADDARAEPLRQALKGANVMLIVLDAARADRFSAYGHSRQTTPEIDRIAKEGVRFPHVFTPAVYTLAAMASVWTSQYPDRHHSEVSFSAKLPTDRLTLAEVLSANGIRTAGFVANAVAGSGFGFDRGFTTFAEVFREHGSGGGIFAHVVPRWLAEHGGERFFAYVHFREPHFPYDPDPPFDTRFGDGPIPKATRREMGWITDLNQGRRQPMPGEIEHLRSLYDGNLAYADQEVGKLRRDLEARGLWDKTVVIVVADHGEALFEDGWIGHNVDLKPGSTHIPLVMHLPKGASVSVKEPGGLADLLDVAPTIAEVFGIPRERYQSSFQGTSLLPRLVGAPGAPAALSRTVWDRPRYALRDDRWTYFHDTRTGEERLYDRQDDPGEKTDVASKEPLRVAYFREEMYAGMAHIAPPRTGGTAEKMTPEQCENLKALGYLGADIKCPTE